MVVPAVSVMLLANTSAAPPLRVATSAPSAVRLTSPRREVTESTGRSPSAVNDRLTAVLVPASASSCVRADTSLKVYELSCAVTGPLAVACCCPSRMRRSITAAARLPVTTSALLVKLSADTVR